MRYIFILVALLCTSCGTALPTIKPYKLDVQQGNVVTSKMLLQLRPGMTKSQVRFIMGTPLIQDSFHGNRWDYFYQMRESGKVKEQRRVILDFENELLKSVRGDVIPAGSDPTKTDESKSNTGTRVVTPVKKPEEKGLMDKLKFWEKDEAALAKEAAEKEAAAKSKLEAEEAAKNAAAKEKAVPATEEPKSLLAVPVEMATTPEAPAPAVESLLNATPLVDAAKVESTTVEPAPAIVQVAPVEPVVVQQPNEPLPPTELPVKVPSYEPSSGMVFDRKMRFGTEEAESVAAPAAIEPRAGNKVPPKPKDLPEEGTPGFFDRMLEKIGF